MWFVAERGGRVVAWGYKHGAARGLVSGVRRTRGRHLCFRLRSLDSPIMLADPLDTARKDVLEGRRRLASQEQLVDDLLRIGCTSLFPIAERLLRYTRERQHARERHLDNLVIATHVPRLASLIG